MWLHLHQHKQHGRTQKSQTPKTRPTLSKICLLDLRVPNKRKLPKWRIQTDNAQESTPCRRDHLYYVHIQNRKTICNGSTFGLGARCRSSGLVMCNQCDYKAGGAFGEIMLRRHMARHTQERNFQCDQCEFRGYTKYDLGKHYYNRHEVSPPKYVCNYCDYTSNDSSNFKAHQEAKHGSWISCTKPSQEGPWESTKRSIPLTYISLPFNKTPQELIANAVLATLWLSITNLQCHDSSFTICH